MLYLNANAGMRASQDMKPNRARSPHRSCSLRTVANRMTRSLNAFQRVCGTVVCVGFCLGIGITVSVGDGIVDVSLERGLDESSNVSPWWVFWCLGVLS